MKKQKSPVAPDFRYRPAVDFYKFKEEDITDSIMKFV